MELLQDWRDVLSRAWSMKLMGFAAFLEVAGELVPYLSEYIPWWASVLVLLLGMVARLLKQPEKADAEQA